MHENDGLALTINLKIDGANRSGRHERASMKRFSQICSQGMSRGRLRSDVLDIRASPALASPPTNVIIYRYQKSSSVPAEQQPCRTTNGGRISADQAESSATWNKCVAKIESTASANSRQSELIASLVRDTFLKRIGG